MFSAMKSKVSLNVIMYAVSIEICGMGISTASAMEMKGTNNSDSAGSATASQTAGSVSSPDEGAVPMQLLKDGGVSLSGVDKQINPRKRALGDGDSELEAMRVAWWAKDYVGSESFVEEFFERHKIIIAEATFWSIEHGLDKAVEGWNYAQVLEFQPLKLDENSDLGKLVGLVRKRLLNPVWLSEEALALRQAVRSVYVRKHGYDAAKKEEAAYKAACKANKEYK